MAQTLAKLRQGPFVVLESLRKITPELGMMAGAQSKAELTRMRVDRFRRGEADVPPVETRRLRIKLEDALRAIGYTTVRTRSQVEQSWVTGIR